MLLELHIIQRLAGHYHQPLLSVNISEHKMAIICLLEDKSEIKLATGWVVILKRYSHPKRRETQQILDINKFTQVAETYSC